MITVNVHRFIQICLQLLSPVYILCCLHMLSFSQCEYFSTHCCTIVHIHCLHWIFTVTYSTVYNYTTQYTVCAFYICFLFTRWYFFTITDQLTLQQCLQHIRNIYIQYCLQLHYPVYCMCFLHMLPFHNVIFFHNYCPIDSTTMSTAYPQHIHAVMFTITFPVYWLSCLHLLFLFTMWIFSSITVQLSIYNV